MNKNKDSILLPSLISNLNDNYEGIQETIEYECERYKKALLNLPLVCRLSKKDFLAYIYARVAPHIDSITIKNVNWLNGVIAYLADNYWEEFCNNSYANDFPRISADVAKQLIGADILNEAFRTQIPSIVPPNYGQDFPTLERRLIDNLKYYQQIDVRNVLISMYMQDVAPDTIKWLNDSLWDYKSIHPHRKLDFLDFMIYINCGNEDFSNMLPPFKQIIKKWWELYIGEVEEQT